MWKAQNQSCQKETVTKQRQRSMVLSEMVVNVNMCHRLYIFKKQFLRLIVEG